MVGDPQLEKALTGFHHQEVRRMAGMVPKRQLDGTWVYTPIQEALAMVGLDEIRAYIARRQNKVSQYIATRTIIDLCMVAEGRVVMRLSWKCWEHLALYILGIRAGSAAA